MKGDDPILSNETKTEATKWGRPEVETPKVEEATLGGK